MNKIPKRYKVEDIIGGGVFGIVYKVADTENNNKL